ncbi:1-deoxy-D-xylulose 5-phosphate reductoisomerase, partial [Haematococcus lacustris]
MRLNEACCEAHKQDWVGVPDLDQIVHYDSWARQWVREKVASGAYKSSKVFSMAA